MKKQKQKQEQLPIKVQEAMEEARDNQRRSYVDGILMAYRYGLSYSNLLDEININLAIIEKYEEIFGGNKEKVTQENWDLAVDSWQLEKDGEEDAER